MKLKRDAKFGEESLGANPTVLDVTPEGFHQVYLPNSNRFMDDIRLIHNSHLGGGIGNKNIWFQILVMNL